MPYPASKFSMEHYCQVFYHMYQLPVTILRLSNVFGPGQTLSNPYCGVVTRFFNAIQAGEPIPIYGNGHQTRDFTYIDDAMDAIILAADIPETAGKVYNVGTGKETSVNTLANKITEITGRIFYPTKNLPKRVIDKVDRRAVDISLIGKELDWSPRYTLEEGLALTYEWIGEQQVS
jgi:UDP-glucose 4-epimerase